MYEFSSADMTKARELLENGATCALVKGDSSVCSSERGVSFLFSLVSEKKNFEGYSVADKIVGKAAAYLLVLLGVKAVFASVVSRSALRVLQDGGASVSYDVVCPYVINRNGTAPCPMETAVENALSPSDAAEKIRSALESLRLKTSSSDDDA